MTDGFTADGSKGAEFNAIFRDCVIPFDFLITPQANYRKLSGYYVGRMPGETAHSIAEKLVSEEGHVLKLNTFPNPVSQTINVEIELVETAFVEVRLYDIYGRLAAVLETGIFVDKGELTLSFPVNQLPNGSYLLETNIDGNSHISNFIKSD